MRKKELIKKLEKEINLDIQLKQDLVSSNTKFMELIHILNDTISEENYLHKKRYMEALVKMNTENYSKPKKSLNKNQWNKKKKRQKMAKKSRKINRK